MSLLDTYSHVLNPDYSEVISHVRKVTPTIEQVPIAAATNDHAKVEERRAQTLEALNTAANMRQKPDLLRREVFPGVMVTTWYSKDEEKRLQILETNGQVTISLVAARALKEDVLKNPTLITEDAAVSSFVFSRTDLTKCLSAEVNPRVEFKSEVDPNKEIIIRNATGRLRQVLGAIESPDARKPVVQETPVSAVIKETLRHNIQEAKGIVDMMHLIAIDTIKEIIEKDRFNSNESKVWEVPASIRKALVGALENQLENLTDIKQFGVKDWRPGGYSTIMEVGEYCIVIGEDRKTKHATLRVFRGKFDLTNPRMDAPEIEMGFDLDKKVGAVYQMSFVLPSGLLQQAKRS